MVFFKTACVVVAITIVLFVLVNLGAQLYLNGHPISVADKPLFLDAESSEGLEIRKGYSIQMISAC